MIRLKAQPWQSQPEACLYPEAAGHVRQDTLPGGPAWATPVPVGREQQDEKFAKHSSRIQAHCAKLKSPFTRLTIKKDNVLFQKKENLREGT